MGTRKRFLGFLLLPFLFQPSEANEDWHGFEPEKVTLSGRIIYEDFFGPPNYGENPATDTIETAAILVLYSPINVAASQNNPVNSVAIVGVKRLQLVVPWEKLEGKEIKGRNVTVTGTLFSAFSGHHRTPVLMSIESLKIQDVRYPDFPWQTSSDYDRALFFEGAGQNDLANEIDIISLYEGVQGEGGEIYNVGEALLRRKLLNSIKDKKQIMEFFRILHASKPKTSDFTICPNYDGQKEIHVIAFDYSKSRAGYLVMHFCENDTQTLTIQEMVLGNLTLPMSESLEMTDLLKGLGITPE